jgi:hypothetical protein
VLKIRLAHLLAWRGSIVHDAGPVGLDPMHA